MHADVVKLSELEGIMRFLVRNIADLHAALNEAVTGKRSKDRELALKIAGRCARDICMLEAEANAALPMLHLPFHPAPIHFPNIAPSYTEAVLDIAMRIRWLLWSITGDEDDGYITQVAVGSPELDRWQVEVDQMLLVSNWSETAVAWISTELRQASDRARTSDPSVEVPPRLLGGAVIIDEQKKTLRRADSELVTKFSGDNNSQWEMCRLVAKAHPNSAADAVSRQFSGLDGDTRQNTNRKLRSIGLQISADYRWEMVDTRTPATDRRKL